MRHIARPAGVHHFEGIPRCRHPLQRSEPGAGLDNRMQAVLPVANAALVV
jgi:hypothetical protein